MPRPLTPAQRARLERVSPEAFRELRRERQRVLAQLQEEGCTVRAIAEELGVHHPAVVKWTHEEL